MNGCVSQPAFVGGTTFDYVQALNVDVAFVLVYDKMGALVAELEWSANGGVLGCAWRCVEGPANFDATEAMSLLPVVGRGSLASACAARSRDAAGD
jgi:hypothetical protein